MSMMKLVRFMPLQLKPESGPNYLILGVEFNWNFLKLSHLQTAADTNLSMTKHI